MFGISPLEAGALYAISLKMKGCRPFPDGILSFRFLLLRFGPSRFVLPSLVLASPLAFRTLRSPGGYLPVTGLMSFTRSCVETVPR